MLTTILFDLDNTLLGNDMQNFIPRYFALLGEYAEKYLPRREFVQHVMQASDGMVRNTDPQASNRDVFWEHFVSQTGLDGDLLEADFDAFYQKEFGQLREVTVPQPAALPLIELSRRAGLEIVIATNPMFPRRAIEARLSWAGLPVQEHEFALVTTIENMHATKPHEVYYEEILAQISCAPHEALMVGDDWQNDIIPAANLGMRTYWIQLPGKELPDGPIQPTAYGTLDHLLELAESGWFETLGAA
jgi:HAD superfamily hydrolase (TIGR01549 family)